MRISLLDNRIGPIAVGGALAGASALVALNDPAAANSRFPACLFRSATGLWCPACGLTRGFHQLFNGHVGSALQYNIFIPLVIAAAVIAWVSWLRTTWNRPRLQVPALLTRQTAFALPIALVVYAVLRNIPAAPFEALAP